MRPRSRDAGPLEPHVAWGRSHAWRTCELICPPGTTRCTVITSPGRVDRRGETTRGGSGYRWGRQHASPHDFSRTIHSFFPTTFGELAILREKRRRGGERAAFKGPAVTYAHSDNHIRYFANSLYGEKSPVHAPPVKRRFATSITLVSTVYPELRVQFVTCVIT